MEHSKKYRISKNLLVGTISTAAMVLSATTVNAAENNSNVNSDATSTQVQASNNDQNQVVANASQDKGTNAAGTEQVNKNEMGGVNKTANGSENTSTDSSLQKDEDQNSDKKNDDQKAAVEEKSDKKANKKTATAQTSDVNTNKPKVEKDKKDSKNSKDSTKAKAKLNNKVAEIVKNAGIDANKLSADQVEELNKIDFSKEAKSGTQLTYTDFKNIAEAIINQDPRYAVPFFNAKEIKNMPAATTVDAQTGKVEKLDIWDSWPVQDAKTGLVSNWNGYQLVIGMMGVPGSNDNHIYLLYNKYGDNKLENWKNAGPIFGQGTPLDQEWSGSATVNDDNSIQLYYTKVDTREDTNHQKIASATLNLAHDDSKNEVSVKSVDNDHVIFEGDGDHYQTYDQWKSTNTGADNVAMRDAHVFEDNDGNRYLIFEASTGKENYQGKDQIYKWINYGGKDKDNIKDFFQILSNPDIKDRARWANAAIGIIKLTDDQKNPQLDTIYTPLVSAPMVTDEIERPDLVKLGDKYYLFAATRLNRGSNDDMWQAANDTVGDNVAMIGYVSDNLTSGYKPLNKSGVVLTASVPANWRTATYSYYAVPVKGRDDQVLITSYITNRGEVAGEGQNSTWAPSFLLQINSDGTTSVLGKTTNQGDWIWDKDSENDNMLGVLEKDAENSAALPGEWDKAIDWNLIGDYGLKPHQPADDRDLVGGPVDDTNYDLPDFHIPSEDKEEPKKQPSENPTPKEDPGKQPTPITDKKVERPTLTRLQEKHNKKNPVARVLLPHTGAHANTNAGVIGLLVSMFSILGLAGTRKRKNQD